MAKPIQTKAKSKRRRRFPLWLLLPIALLVYVGFLFMSNISVLRDVNGTKSELQQQLSDVQAQNDELREQVEFGGTPSFIERKARELLGWVYPGEYRVIQGQGE